MRRRSAGGPAPLLLFPGDREAADREAERLAAELRQHDRMRTHEADLSPPDMAGQACWAIETVMGGRWDDKGPDRILDPTCGAGVFPMAARAQWPNASEIYGVEARAEEEAHLDHHCTAYDIGDFFAQDLEPGFDLVITNPPFSLIVDLLPRCLELVRPGGLVAFVCRLTWGDKPEADRLWRPPFSLASILEFASDLSSGTAARKLGLASAPARDSADAFNMLLWWLSHHLIGLPRRFMTSAERKRVNRAAKGSSEPGP